MIGLDPPLKTRERVSLTCPLGLRFVDLATGELVREGLHATASPPGRPGVSVESVVNASGVHAFHGLPGLRAFENSSAGDPWLPPPAARVFQMTVADAERRFLPCTFLASAPQPGFANLGPGGPAWLPAGAIPLFPAPWRAVPPGCAVLRADLREFATGRPAAWAMVEATYLAAGQAFTARALADGAGQLALLFPLPEAPHTFSAASPPPLAETHLPLSLSFAFAPLDPAEPLADYALRLAQPAAVAQRAASPASPVVDATLTFGQELDLGLLELT